jgi:5-methylcytosine-specific restriction endonuclease McrA
MTEHGHSQTSGSARLRRKLWRAGRPMICHWCDSKLVLKTATVDHLLPREKAGRDKVENLVWACEECNRARGRAQWLTNET